MTNNQYLHWLQSWLQRLAARFIFRVLKKKKPAPRAGFGGVRGGFRTHGHSIKSPVRPVR